MGFQFLSLINFTLLVISVSDKLKGHFHINETWVFVGVSVCFGFFAVWTFGFFLDVFVRYKQSYVIEETNRNPRWQMMMDEIRIIRKLVDKKDDR